MEFLVDDQLAQPITNEVEVLNGGAYRDFVLRPRIQPLLDARTSGQLLAALAPVSRSLSVFGDVPGFSLTKAVPNLEAKRDAKPHGVGTAGFNGQEIGAVGNASNKIHTQRLDQMPDDPLVPINATQIGSKQAKPADPSKTTPRQIKPGEVLNLRTIIDLSNARPAHSVSFIQRTARDVLGVEAAWRVSNRLGLGDVFEVRGAVQNDPNKLASGTAALTSPLQLGRGALTLKGFFHNEDRGWASHSLATHGVAAQLATPGIGGLWLRGGVQAVAREIHTISDGASDAVRAAAGASSLKVSALAEAAHAGAFHSARAFVEAAGSPGDAHHVKTVADVGATLPLFFGDNLVLSVRGRAGCVAARDGKAVRLCDNFLVGGPEDVLGAQRFRLGPREGGDYVGGQAFYTTRLALLSRFPLKELSPLRFKAQLDAGVLQAHAKPSLGGTLRSLLQETPVVSSAAGLSFASKNAAFDVLYVVPVENGAVYEPHRGLHVSAELGWH